MMKKLIEKLKKLIPKRFLKKDSEKAEYELLSPKEDIDIKTKDALDFAFKNKKAKNIAITGNYSSGKSSTILSYLNKEKIKSDEIVNVSLGTFKEPDELDSEVLEKYIIDQMYFSTYKAVKKLSNKGIIIFTLMLAILAICIFYSNIGYLFTNMYNILFIEKEYMEFFRLSFIIAIIVSFFSVLYIKLLNFAVRISLKLKMTVQYKDMKFELENNNATAQTNLINKNIQQILNMLKRAKCKYIIFEDIDRFDKPEIFEHLKELNDILNNTINIKFIYLIKDDVFKGENRTKFFDYIYPVVPYISYGNSGEEFYRLVEKYGLTKKLPKDFILKVTYYIQDMRILKNTLNEFRIYSIDINTKGIDYKNLFSIILYKNIFSEDFAKLQNKDGNLFNLFSKKEKIVNEMRNNISKAESSADDSDEAERTCKSIISNIKQTASSKNTTATLFNPNVGEVSLNDNNKILSKFLSDSNTEIYLGGNKFKKIDEYVQRFCSYSLRYDFENLVKKNIDKTEERQKELEKLRTELSQFEEFSMTDLLNRGNITEEDFNVFVDGTQNNIRKSELVQFLLREGYIDEDYERYISKFHEGTLTPNDYDFIGNCQIDRMSDFLLRLDNPELVIDKLEEKYFLKPSILNINLSKVLFDTRNKEKKENYISAFLKSPNIITNLTEINKRFSKEELKKFYTLLSRNSTAFLIINNKVEEENKPLLLRYFLLYSYAPNISLQEDVSDLKEYIENENLLLTEIEETDSAKEVINSLDIKYTDLTEGLKNNIEVFKYCIENNYYKINIENIKCVVRYLTENTDFEKDVDLENDLSIIRKNEEVYSYIKENIHEFIDNVYMLHENDNDEDVVIELLNDERIEEYWSGISVREVAITKYKIIDLSEIKNESIYDHLLKINLVEATIDNINTFYNSRIYNKDGEKNETDVERAEETLIEFINNNYNRFVGRRSDDIKYSKLNNFIFTENRISDDAYESVVGIFDVKINNMDITGLSEEKIMYLISDQKIALNENMYNYIRKCGKKAFIRFTYEERSTIFGNVTKYKFNLNERNLLLIDRQYNFDYRYKRALVYSIANYEDIVSDKGVSNYIIKYILDNNLKVEYSVEQIEVLIRNCTMDRLKIRFLIYNIDKFDKNELKSAVRAYLPKYRKILTDRARPEYDYTTTLKHFIDVLIEKGFNIKYELRDNKIYVKGTIK